LPQSWLAPQATQRALGVSQPAVSAALARLRRHFDDPLLRRTGNSYSLTPLAMLLKEQTSVALGALLDEQAPGVRLHLEHHTARIIDHTAEHLRLVEGVLMPHGFITGLPFTDLYEDGWRCLVSASNRRVGDELTMGLLAELPWAFTYFSPTAFTPAGRQLQMLGVEPRVQIIVESFLALPFVIAGTDRLALVQSHLVPRLTAAGDVRALPCPFDAVPIAEALWWHPMYERDPAHLWLRQRLAEAGRRISDEAPLSARAGMVAPD
jgi:DNA-binding transcriptional LysR family regulator